MDDERKERRKAYERFYRASNKRKMRELQRRRKRSIETQRAYEKRYPEKHLARKITRRALRNGELKRPDHCTRCGVIEKPQAHHPDYSKPLEIMWLCKMCHAFVHLIERRAKRNWTPIKNWQIEHLNFFGKPWCQRMNWRGSSQIFKLAGTPGKVTCKMCSYQAKRVKWLG